MMDNDYISTEFCKISGESIISSIQQCIISNQGRNIELHKSIPLALKIGRICAPMLSYNTRAVLIPSIMVTSLTPLDDDDEEEGVLMVVNQGNGMYMESLEKMGNLDRFSFQKQNSFINISFNGSESIGDGTRKEWISRMLAQVMKPAFGGLFQYSDEREIFMKPSVDNGSVAQYRQIGRIIGMAIVDGICPGISLTDGALSLLLNYPMLVESPDQTIEKMLKSENKDLWKSLINFKNHMDNDKEYNDLDLTIPGGQDGGCIICGNIQEFVYLKMRFEVITKIQKQMTNLLHGIYEVLPYGQFNYLTLDELRDMLRGQHAEINVAGLQSATDVGEGGDTIIGWFWEIMESMNQDTLKKFLKFVSGSPFEPIHGFAGISGDRKWLKVSVEDS